MYKYLNWISRLALISLVSLGDNLPGLQSSAVLAQNTIPPATTNSQPKLNPVAPNQRGDRFKIVYVKTNDRSSLQLMEAYHKNQLFNKVAKVITTKINLPRNITLLIKDCGEVNAYYNSSNHSITMCNELTKSNYQVFRQAGFDNEQAWQAAIYATIFVFYHEAGHMLINELDIPVAGREEDAADQFSAYLLLNNDPTEGKKMSKSIVEAGADWFNLTATKPSKESMLGEHSLNQQRFYNLVCILYGADPNTYSELVKKLNYPDRRLNGCRLEYQQIASSWKRLLEPYENKGY
jgi:Putative metallopeptidase